jgi:O-antigen/teichoic acid export membrane protein
MLSNLFNLRYLNSGSWLLFEQAFRVVFSTLYILFLARYLGPNDFGIFIYALTMIGIIKVFINFGVEDILVKMIGMNPLNFKEYLSAALYLKIFINFIFFTLFLLIYLLGFNESFVLLTLIILLALNFFSTFEVIGFYYESQVQGKKIALCKIAQLIAVASIKIYLLINEYDLIFFIIAYGLEFFFLGIFYCISFNKYLKEFLFNSFKMSNLKKIYLESFGYLIIGIAGVLFVRVDQLMVKNLLDYEQLGYFGLTVRFTDVLFILAIIFAKTIFPLMIENSKNEKEYNFFLKRVFIGIVWFCSIISFLIIYAGNYIISTFLPESNYVESFNVLVIYIWILIPYFYNQITYRWLMIKNKVKDNLTRLLCGLIINFTLNFILIPIYGIYGAAFSTLISFLFIGFLIDIFFDYSRKLFIFKLQSLNPLNISELFVYFKKILRQKT